MLGNWKGTGRWFSLDFSFEGRAVVSSSEHTRRLLTTSQIYIGTLDGRRMCQVLRLLLRHIGRVSRVSLARDRRVELGRVWSNMTLELLSGSFAGPTCCSRQACESLDMMGDECGLLCAGAEGRGGEGARAALGRVMRPAQAPGLGGSNNLENLAVIIGGFLHY